jgi:SHS2 domain-containing protein
MCEQADPKERDDQGHRIKDHDGDAAIEAWGPSLEACLAEASAGLIGSFASTDHLTARASRPVSIDEATPEAALVALLEDVLYRLDVLDEVPVRVHLRQSENGGFTGEADVVPAEEVEVFGPVPKAITYHDLVMTRDGLGWRCHVVVDR